MTESFIMAAFNRMGQRPLAVKVMRNKFTGEPAGYAFVHFQVWYEIIKHFSSFDQVFLLTADVIKILNYRQMKKQLMPCTN